jgi:hypothetical protein
MIRAYVDRTDFFELGRSLAFGFFEGIGRVLDAIADTVWPLAIALILLAPTTAYAATEAQLRAALAQAHRDVTGKAPSANRLAVAMAQVGLEVGRGKHVTCNNIGQIAAPRKAPHCYTKGGFRVRRYRSLRASAAAYWRLRAVRGALPWFDRRDVRGAALALRRGGYYTAPSAEYAERMMAVYREQQRAKL